MSTRLRLDSRLTASGHARTLSANTIRPQSVFPRKTRPTHCAAFRIASNPRNSDSRIRYASRRYSRRALRIRLSVYWYGTLRVSRVRTPDSWSRKWLTKNNAPEHDYSTPVVVIEIDPF